MPIFCNYPASSALSTCRYNATTIAPGYYCHNTTSRSCTKCPSGTYGIGGYRCQSCRSGTTSISGSTSAAACGYSLDFHKDGLEEVYIPFNVLKINVVMWGGGGGGGFGFSRDGLYSSGGGGGFASCNVTVQPDSNIYVFVGGGGESMQNDSARVRGGKRLVFLL